MSHLHALSMRVMAQTLSETTVIAIAAGVGGTVLITICVLLILLYRQITKHKRLLADLEQRGIDFCRPNVYETDPDPTRPVSALRRSSFVPFGTPTGWSNLDSSEDISLHLPSRPVHTPEAKNHLQRTTSRIGWPFSKRKDSEPALPLRDVKIPHLSAIIESPVGLDLDSTFVPADTARVGNDTTRSPKDNSRSSNISEVKNNSEEENYCSSPFVRADATISADSLTPKPLFSSNELREGPVKVSKKRNRAKTVGETIRHVSPDSVLSSAPSTRPRIHARSVSLGAQNPASAAPDGPVPPLPLSVAVKQPDERPRSWVQERSASRQSGSSLESVGSSLLASPKIKRSLSAKLNDGPSHNWSNSLIAGPRPLQLKSHLEKSSVSPSGKSAHESIKSSAAQYGCGSEERCDLSRESSEASIDSSSNRLSVPLIDTAERVRLSRLSGGSPRPTQVIRTPRHSSRLSVASNGSPSERPRTFALRDVSGNQSIPSCRTSQVSSRASSTRSSNGNPFQWDPSPMQSSKPSALKGSPSSRKGHRRQNCVRISLSPTIIGSHRPSPSPSMADIAEESPEQDKEIERPPTRLSFSGNRALPRPPSSSTFAPDVKLNPTTLRASLTPNSPTLLLHNFAPERDISTSSFSFTASPPKLSRPRGDSSASTFTIPTFPSPGKAVTAINKSTIPTPTFSFSRPSGEFDEEGEDYTPPEFRLLAEPVIVSESPSPLELSEVNLVVSSPPADDSFIFSQLHTDQLDEEPLGIVAAQSEPPPTVDPTEVLLSGWPWSNTLTRNDTHRQIDSPPLSPKSQRASPEPNWSSIPQQPSPQIPIEPTIDPALAPEEVQAAAGASHLSDDETSPLTTTSTTSNLRPETSAPPALHETPVSPLRRSIAALRRMNSDAKKSSESRSARRYLKLGKEPSMPVLDVDAVLAGRGVLRERYDSWVSVPEIPIELLVGEGVGEAEGHEREADGFGFARVVWAGEEEDSWGESQRKEDLEVFEGGDERQDTITDLEEFDSDVRKGNWTSVWDDGERYWNNMDEPEKREEFDPSVMAAKRDSGNRSMIEHRRIAQLRGEALDDQKVLRKQADAKTPPPNVKIQPPTPGSCGSPGSLYDENGFYKGE